MIIVTTKLVSLKMLIRSIKQACWRFSFYNQDTAFRVVKPLAVFLSQDASWGKAN